MKPSAGRKDYDVNWVFPMKYLKYQAVGESMGWIYNCLLYTSDAADE